MTTDRPEAEFKEGDNVVIIAGQYSGQTSKITKVYPTQDTIRGTETRFAYHTSTSPEIYRAKDLQRS